MTGIQTYNDENLARLKLWLSSSSDQEHKKYYEVLVDGMKIIYKTDDLSKLEDLGMWVNANAKIIKVLVYSSEGSHRYQTFTFHTEDYLKVLEAEKQKKDETSQQALSGHAYDIDRKIFDAIQSERKEQAFENLKKENKSLKEQLGEANSYIGKLEDKVHQNESKAFKLNKETMIDVAGGILGHVVKANPDILEKVPGLSGLATAFVSSDSKKETEEQSEVTFKLKKTNPDAQKDEEEEEDYDEETQAKLDLFDTAEEKLNDEEYDMYFKIVNYLAHHPKVVPTIYGLLKDESKIKKQAA